MNGEKYWEDLGRCALACEGWRWVPGMLTVSGHRCVDILNDGIMWSERRYGGCEWKDAVTAIPDLCDPATVGCLLALVREGWGFDARAIRADHGTKWVVVVGLRSCDVTLPRETEAEAIVAALEQVGP